MNEYNAIMLIGIGLIIFGFRKVIRAIWLSLCCRTGTNAIITQQQKRFVDELRTDDYDGVADHYNTKVKWDYVYRFEVDGEAHQGIFRAGDDCPRFKAGDAVQVRYNARWPVLSNLTEERKLSKFGSGTIRYILAGVILILIGRAFF